MLRIFPALIVSLLLPGRELIAAAHTNSGRLVLIAHANKMEKLIFPQEIEVWYILPAIRKKIALKLIEKNFSQKEVAEMMGLTEAAVSQYKKQKRAKEEIFDQKLEKELEKSVGKIIKNNSCLSAEIIRLNHLIKKRGILCKAYQTICALKKSKKCPYCRCRLV